MRKQRIGDLIIGVSTIILIGYLILTSYFIYHNEFDTALYYIPIPIVLSLLLLGVFLYRLIKKLRKR